VGGARKRRVPPAVRVIPAPGTLPAFLMIDTEVMLDASTPPFSSPVEVIAVLCRNEHHGSCPSNLKTYTPPDQIPGRDV
jgi:hypothetical protein